MASNHGIAQCDKEVIIQFDEYEAIKLVNHNNLPQDKASEMMKISRPILTLIYNSALKKTSEAFVKGKIT